MKRLIPIIVLLFAMSAYSQTDVNDLRLVESFDDLHCESLLARLDNMAIEANNDPQAKVYLVIYPGNDPIKNYFYLRFLRSFPVFRKLPKERFSIVAAEEGSKLRFEFWISAHGIAKPAVKETELRLKLSPDVTRQQFVTDTVEVTRIDGRYTYFGYCPVCCGETLDIGVLATFIDANPQFKARVSIFSRSRVTAERLRSLIQTEAYTEHSIARSDLTVVYKGADKDTRELPRGFATVVIDLIARN